MISRRKYAKLLVGGDFARLGLLYMWRCSATASSCRWRTTDGCLREESHQQHGQGWGAEGGLFGNLGGQKVPDICSNFIYLITRGTSYSPTFSPDYTQKE
jgi:hypothetical protein